MKKVDKALLDQIEILFDFVGLDKESYLEQKDIILNPNSDQLDFEMSCGIILAILGSLIKNSKLKKYIDKKALSSLAKDLENASSDDIENEEFYDLISRVHEVAYETIGKDHINNIKDVLEMTIEGMSIDKNKTAKLNEISMAKSVDENLDIIANCITEMSLSLSLKTQKNASERYRKGEATSKKPTSEAQRRLDHVTAMSDQIIEMIKNNEIDFEKLEEKIAKFADIGRKFNTMLELGQENRSFMTQGQTQQQGQENRSFMTQGQEQQTQGQTQQQGQEQQEQKDNEKKKKKDNKGKKKNKKKNKKRKKTVLIVGGCVLALTLATGAGVLLDKFVLNGKAPIDDPSISDDINGLKDELSENAELVYSNWTEHGVDIKKEEVVEIIKALNHMDSAITFREAQERVNSVLSAIIQPHFTGEVDSIDDIDVASLILGDKAGLTALERMEDYLNGCINGDEELSTYAENAFVAQIAVLGGSTKDGLTNDDSTDPAIRVLWARTASWVNLYASTLGEDFTVIVDGQSFEQSELNSGPKLNDEVVEPAIKSIGQGSYAIKPIK